MKNKNFNIDYVVNKILNETLEEKADEVLSKIKSKMEENMDEGEWTEIDLSDEKNVCSECGSAMREGECMECGAKYESMETEMRDLSGEFDYVETDEEVEEGNKFTGELMKAKEQGKDKFEVDGKVYHVREAKEKKFIQKAVKKMDKKGTTGSFKEYCGGEVTQSCIKKAMKSGDPDLVKKANFAKNIKAYRGAKHESKIKESIQLTEEELIDVIEKLVREEETKSNLRKSAKPRGLSTYEKAHKGSGKENEDYIKSVTKKLKDYLKDGSMGEYEMNPKHFPAGNGELKKMSKMAYTPSSEVQDYTDNLTAAGQENLVYDEIHPNEEWVSDNMEGASRTGNNPKWANAVETPANKKRNKVRKDNLLGAIKTQAYNKSAQPIVSDETGSDNKKGHFGVKSNKKVNQLMAKLESEEERSENLIKEEKDKMQKLMFYNKKTQ